MRSARIFRTSVIGFISLFLVGLSETVRAQQSALAKPPAGMVQAYQLGYDVYLPIAQMQYFNHQVLSLSSSDDAENAPKIAALDKLIDKTRLVEQLSMKQAADLLLKMGATKQVRAPYEQAAAELAKPLQLAADAKKDKKLDSASARVLSTMEEADRLIPSDTAPLITWLRLEKGSDADWSFHVGTLEASLAVASDNDEPAIALLATVPALAEKAPASAPAGAKDAMVDLMQKVQKSQDVSQQMLIDTTRALHKAFESE